MNNIPRQKLKEIILQYGHSLCDDPKRCGAFLLDFCGQYRKEVSVLVNALKEKVALDLLASSSNVPLEVKIAQLTKRLQDNLGLTQEAARWAVESWGVALGVISEKDLKVDSPSPPHHVASKKRREKVNHAPVTLSPPSPPPPQTFSPPQAPQKKSDSRWTTLAWFLGASTALIAIAAIIPRLSPQEEVITPTPAPIPTPTRPIIPTPTPVPIPTRPIIPIPTLTSFDADSARRLAQTYLNAKPALFAPPFDRNLLASVTTGRRYGKAIDSMDWLRSSGAYYRYKTSEVLRVRNFSGSGSQPTIEVLVSEDRVFYKNGKVDSSRTTFGAEQEWFIFTFQQDGGIWKVENTESS